MSNQTKTNQPNPLLPELRPARITIRQLWQLPVIDLATLDPAKRQAEEARRKALLEQAARVSERGKEHA